MRLLVSFILCLIGTELLAQQNPGIIMGSVLDEKNRALEGTSVELTSLKDSFSRSLITDGAGGFQFQSLPFGYYRLRFTYTGLKPVLLDSIHLRAERYDFNLNDIILKIPDSAGTMEEVIIYAEKPLIQSREGNITFNAGESALSAGSNAGELLSHVPLVTRDPSGKILVRGKEPRILIDDKPVELNLQQLQDMLESMPGSTIEKIEVMTNPPPQYANEQGGVINIVTKKGTVGMNGRISVYAGTRGEGGINGSFNYRKQGFSVNINAGGGYNSFRGEGYSNRQNMYTDSTNYFRTSNAYRNRNIRPNFRANIHYEPDKFHAFNWVLHYNGNDFNNRNTTTYRHINKDDAVYRLSERSIRSSGKNDNPNLSFSYTMKTRKAGESLRLITSWNFSSSRNTRNFFQQFLYPDGNPDGSDSTQEQVTDNRTQGYQIRLNYDLPLSNKKTHLSFGTLVHRSKSDVDVDASYFSKPDDHWKEMDILANEFRFRQDLANLRASLKQVISENFSTTMGITAEHTRIHFDLYKTGSDTSNRYWSYLPFATLNRNWKDRINLSFSYRRTIRRPGINELNPTIDFGDPYNIRYGNPGLNASMAHNFDLVLGKTKTSYYANIGLGFNQVDDIYAPVRTLQADGKTHITWENLSGRKEYEISTWSGYTVSKQFKVNLSASYTYNEYSSFDKTVRRYRDGGSLSSNLNAHYNLRDLYSATGSFTFNRFANPQGTVRSTLSMNIGLQAKLLRKKMTATVNVIDPFIQQKNRSYTYGKNFVLESFSTTQTRNFRLSLAYNFSKKPKRPQPGKPELKTRKPQISS